MLPFRIIFIFIHHLLDFKKEKAITSTKEAFDAVDKANEKHVIIDGREKSLENK